MAESQNQKPSPQAVQEAEQQWHEFMKVSQICGAVIAVVLTGMALFLV